MGTCAGRAEPLRMTLAAAGVEFDFEEAQTSEMKSDLENYHFAQVPRCPCGLRRNTPALTALLSYALLANLPDSV